MLLDQYSLTDHSRLLHSIVNPLFQRARRFMLREILRLTNKKSLFFETNKKTILPDVFSDMINVRRRKFPHLLERKWDLEKDLEYVSLTHFLKKSANNFRLKNQGILSQAKTKTVIHSMKKKPSSH